MHAGEPMVPRKPVARDPVDRGFLAGMLSLCVVLALVAGLVAGGFQIAAHAYRQQHCILILGHWVSVERTTLPMFCQ
jgi:hypothetical protein